jgi:F-type H+-transporting ATPase subunit epsilon
MQLDIVTPDRRMHSLETEEVRLPADVTRVQIPGKEGQFEVLPGHAPFLALLGTGVLTFETAGKEIHLMVSGGFADVDRDRVTVMCEHAALTEEIEAGDEEKSLADAERRLAEMGAVAAEDEEFTRLRGEAERAAAKLHIAR